MDDWFELWDFSDPAATEEAFLLLEPAYRAAGPDKLSELRTQIARTHSLRSQFAKAHAILDEVQETPSLSPRTQAYLHLERGRTHNSAGDAEQARREFVITHELSRRNNIHDLDVDALHMLGIVDKGEAAVSWNRAAIALAESSAQAKARRWLPSLFNNLGWSLHALGRFDEALDAFEAAASMRAERGEQELLQMARWTVARCKRSLGLHEQALEELLSLHEADSKDGYVQEEIAENLVILDRNEEAKRFFRGAYESLAADESFLRNEPMRLERIKRLGGGD